MKVLVDSREKKWEHIKALFDRWEVPYIVGKLDVADYMLEGDDHFAIDRKRSLDEVCMNLMNRNDSSRFWSEIRRAKHKNMKVVILVEQFGYKNIYDVANWSSKYTRVTGKVLMKEMLRIHYAYGIEFLFCDKRHSARMILNLLENHNYTECKPNKKE
jgi:ERCC4-type nuclease